MKDYAQVLDMNNGLNIDNARYLNSPLCYIIFSNFFKIEWRCTFFVVTVLEACRCCDNVIYCRLIPLDIPWTGG